MPRLPRVEDSQASPAGDRSPARRRASSRTRGDADRTHRATRPGLAAAPDELQLADQYGPVADDMGDVLHEHRSPSPAELDAWERARHRRDRERGSRQSDGRTGEETRLVKSETRVGRELYDLPPGTC